MKTQSGTELGAILQGMLTLTRGVCKDGDAVASMGGKAQHSSQLAPAEGTPSTPILNARLRNPEVDMEDSCSTLNHPK